MTGPDFGFRPKINIVYTILKKAEYLGKGLINSQLIKKRQVAFSNS